MGERSLCVKVKAGCECMEGGRMGLLLFGYFVLSIEETKKRVDIEKGRLLNDFLSLPFFPQDLHVIHHFPFCLASRTTVEMRLTGRDES